MRTQGVARSARIVALVAASWGAQAVAQGTTAQVGVSAGSITDERGVRSNAVTLTPAVSLSPSRRAMISFSGSATRFETDAWQLGGAATVAARTGEVAGTALTLNAGGGVSRSSFGATYTVADATPAVEWSVSGVTLFGGARIASGTTTVRVLAPSVIPGPQPRGDTSTSHASAGPVFGAQWAFGGGDGSPPGSVSYREDRSRTAGETITDRIANANLVLGIASLGGSVGDRVSALESSRFGSGTLSLALSPRVRFDAAVGSYPSNPLTGTAAGRYVTAGLNYRFGSDGGNRLPSPSGVRAPAPGLTRLSIRDAQAQSVDLYGDWNDWSPMSAQRAGNGVWYVDVSLAPGEYRYAFRVNGVEWRVPEGAVTTNDGFGGKSAYVTVVRGAAQIGSNSREER